MFKLLLHASYYAIVADSILLVLLQLLVSVPTAVANLILQQQKVKKSAADSALSAEGSDPVHADSLPARTGYSHITDFSVAEAAADPAESADSHLVPDPDPVTLLHNMLQILQILIIHRLLQNLLRMLRILQNLQHLIIL